MVVLGTGKEGENLTRCEPKEGKLIIRRPTILRRRFGRGVKVPHGRDVHWLDPAKYSQRGLRANRRFNGERIILWLGSPTRHEGMRDLAEAIRPLKRTNLRLLMVGCVLGEPLVTRVEQTLGEELTVQGMQPFSELPEFLAVADLVVILQGNSPATCGQAPAKLVDAMAMAEPIISTSVPDIPEILDGCGLTVEPGNLKQISQPFEELLSDEKRAMALGRAVREKCVRADGIEAMEKIRKEVSARYE